MPDNKQPKSSTKVEDPKGTPPAAPQELTIEQKLAAAQEALRLQELDAAEREERIANLEAEQVKAAKAAAGSGNLPTVEVDGKSYRFVYPALFVGKEKLTADEIVEDDDLIAQLIDSGSAAIVAV